MAIDWSELIRQGGNAVQSEAQRRMQSLGLNAHIDAQNSAVEQFQSTALGPYNSGQIPAIEAVNRISRIDTAFGSYARTLGYARALAGQADVHRLAQQLISDIERGVNVPGGGGGSGSGGGGGAVVPPTVPIIGGMSYATVALGAGAAYLLFFGKKRFF